MLTSTFFFLKIHKVTIFSRMITTFLLKMHHFYQFFPTFLHMTSRHPFSDFGPSRKASGRSSNCSCWKRWRSSKMSKRPSWRHGGYTKHGTESQSLRYYYIRLYKPHDDFQPKVSEIVNFNFFPSEDFDNALFPAKIVSKVYVNGLLMSFDCAQLYNWRTGKWRANTWFATLGQDRSQHY